MHLLASEAQQLSQNAIFLRGIAAVITAVLVFVGSTTLVLSTDVGAKKAVLVVLSVWFMFISMLAMLWFRYPQQAPKPTGPVCLAGSINPDFAANGGAEGETTVTVKKVVDGQEADVKISACNGGILFTKFFYPTIFLLGGLSLSALMLLWLRSVEKMDALAEAEAGDEDEEAEAALT